VGVRSHCRVRRRQRGLCSHRRALAGDTPPDAEDPLHAQYAAQGYACVDCHPCGGETNGHEAAWGDPAGQTFHAFAANRGLDPCRSCHGGELDGGGRTSLGCATCHGETWRTGCTMCHGDPDVPGGAPPRATWGNGLDPVRVGAHRAHLEGVHGLAAPVRCDECHVTPGDVFAAGHVDGGTAEVTFGPLASRPTSATAAWDRTTASCTSVYCHGGSLDAGGLATVPVWTSADGSAAACGACHAAPPPEPHPVNPVCGDCHVGFTATSVDRAVHVDGKVDLQLACASCHGGPENAAPPAGTHGESLTSLRAVGAHQAHVRGGALAAPMACAACHVVPGEMLHSDEDATVRFGGVAVAGGAIPDWDRASETCSSTYCHGAFAGGDALNAPSWTIVNGTQATCGSCHGKPPPPPHFANPDCARCHAGYTATTVAVATHVDGVVNVRTMRCDSCHGSAGVPAPPASTRGETATTARAVGAHRRHLEAGAIGAPVPCGTCHLVPTAMDHFDGAVQLLPAAGWEAAISTCANACHGAARPLWTKVDGTQAACGSCHGAPPPAPHVQNGACERCHDGYTAATVNLATHVDGRVDVKPLTCDVCHGGLANAAPPLGTAGETATTARAVGAHQAHLAGGTLGAPVACETCHPVPGAMLHADGAVQVSLPGWDPAAATCSATSCHGAFAPSWTTVDGSQVLCGSCHGVPGAPHTANPACGNCHPGYTASTVNAATHVDGDVDVKPMTCTACHGDETRALAPVAPPLGTSGQTEPSQRGVGAHQRHLAGGAIGKPVACEECHAVPSGMDHADGDVDLAFGPLAHRVGAEPAFDAATGTCSGVYCHGAVLRGGGANVDPSWTGGPAEATCGACHGNPPPPPHVQTKICENCHEGYTLTTVNPPLHMDGVIQSIDLTCSSCHGDESRILVQQADVLAIAAPPFGSRGEEENTTRSVGQHQAHVNRGNGLAIPNKCRYCHVVPPPTALDHADGRNDVAFSSLAVVGGAAPVWDRTNGTCASTYCHGATLNRGGTSHTPSWLGSNPIVCGTCHGAPPPLPHPQDADCIRCHPGYTQTSVRKATHVNGISDFPSGCNSCHDNPPNSGEHYEHIQEGVSCSKCHAGYTRTVENPTLHRNAKQDVTVNGWNPTTRTCGSNSCHGGEYWGRTSAGTAQSCNRCHGVPPASGEHFEHKEYGCARCHGTGYSRTTVNAATHMNGSVTVVVGGWSPTYLRCSSANGCHESEDWGRRGSVTPNCANCHGFPPGLPHPQKTACQDCHSSMKADGTLTAAHNDGYLDISGAGCATCHGFPPTQTRYGGLHTTDANCYGCHSTSVDASNQIVSNGSHNDGAIQIGGGGVGTYGCQACHGDQARTAAEGSDPNVKSAPPTGTRGETDPTALPVGAHLAHVNPAAGSLTAPIACAECHVVPETMDHAHGTASKITFGLRARLGGAAPAWDGEGCTSTYCHGATLGAGGTNHGPTWTGGSAQVACGSCHGAPPPAPHTDSAFCQGCHPGYTATSVNLAKHVNGTVDAGTSCGDCHGLPPPAPHSTGTACGSCHLGYTQATVDPATHGNGTVDVSSPHPAGFAAAAAHGSQVNRDGLAECKTCHGTSLTGGPSGGTCDRCHSGWATSCTFCHGNATTGRASPPVDTQGRTARSYVSVGAHDKHVGTAKMVAIACVACHPARGDAVSDPAHVDPGASEVVFSGQARGLGIWTRTSDTVGSCASTYCHGNFTNGRKATVSWTSTTVMTCNSCHRSQSGSSSYNFTGEHDEHVIDHHIACSYCHGAGYSSTAVNGALHVNGTRDLVSTVRWSATSRSCSSNSCHGSESWY
jgi:predicted CxxxxCH...CXXCH cytochrome family protein